MPPQYLVQRIQDDLLHQRLWLPTIYRRILSRKADFVWKKIAPFVNKNHILDVGVGSGAISYLLKQKQFDVTGVDIKNLNIYDGVTPVLYDGTRLPFGDNTFDSALCIHMLHHCKDGLAVLKEAKRVAKRVIVIEDTYRNRFEWLIVSVLDAVNNNEMWFHTYRTLSEWKDIIKKNKWKTVHTQEWSEWAVAAIYGRYCMFVIE